MRLVIDSTGAVVPARSADGWSTDEAFFGLDIDDCR